MAKTSQEITLKQLYESIAELFSFLLLKWKVIVISGIIGASIGLTVAFFTKKVYFGELVFALEEKNNSMGAYAAIASQFGIDLGGGSGSGAFGGDNLIELLKTRLMLEKTLTTPVIIEGDTELLINRYIDFNELRKSWNKKPELQNLTFDIHQSRSSYSRLQDSVLNKIQTSIKKKMLTIKRTDKRLNMVSVVCESTDELFSKHFPEELLINASNFYIQTKTKKIKTNIGLLEYKIDSVKRILDIRLYGAANSQDQNLNIVTAKQKVPLVQQQIDIQLLTTVYAELSKNIELSRFSLMRDEPILNVIDSPILPLRIEKASKLFNLIVYGIIAGILAIIVLIVQRNISEKSENEENG
jgi:hypothetical protein